MKDEGICLKNDQTMLQKMNALMKQLKNPAGESNLKIIYVNYIPKKLPIIDMNIKKIRLVTTLEETF